MNRKGEYVNLSLDAAGNLVMKPTRELRRNKKWLLEMGDNLALATVLEDHICNSDLEFVLPEEVGALTSSPILSDVAERDDYGELTKCDYVWWFPDYAVASEIEQMLKWGEVVFTKETGE